MGRVLLLHGSLRDDDPAMDHALAHAVLRRASRGEIDGALRVYRPEADVVAFGRRDTHRPRFTEAVEAARSAGFGCVVRPQGGRAVAYTRDTLVVDHVAHDPLSPGGMDERFWEFGQLFVGVLRGFGIDARIGEVPGEYCPGSQSVNARGVVKLVGTAQRMVRDAWLFSSVLVFEGGSVLRPVLESVYGALDLPFDPGSVGSVHGERPGLTLDELEQAVLAAYSSRFELEPVGLATELVDEARSMVHDHQLP